MKLCAWLAALFSGCSSTHQWGRFEGRIVAEWSEDGRSMKLMDTATYVDPANRSWHAMPGDVVDGASIPRPFWSVIGGPFEGRYRVPSVFHDIYCRNYRAQWQDVHRMFFYAMRCSGVGEIKAKIMFAAVWHYGPRWGIDSRTQAHRYARPWDRYTIEEWVTRENPSLEQIEQMLPGK